MQTSMPQGKSSTPRKISVLLFANCELARDMLHSALTTHGFQVSAEEKKEPFEQTIRENAYDVVLIDDHYALESVIAAIPEYREHSKNHAIKFVVQTCLPFEMNQKHALEALTDLFVKKPISPEKLCALLKAIVIDDIRTERRFYRKIPGEVRVLSELFPCEIYDVSSSGLYVSIDFKKYKVEVKSTVMITFATGPHEPQMTIQGEIVRMTDQGFGFKIQSMSTEDRAHFEKYLGEASKEDSFIDTYYI